MEANKEIYVKEQDNIHKIKNLFEEMLIFVDYWFESNRNVVMSRWGNTREEEQGPDFALLLREKGSATELLAGEGFLEEVKNNSGKFTQSILLDAHRNTLYDIIDIAFNPKLYPIRRSIALNNKLTHSAIQILTNLTEDFVQYVFDHNDKSEDEVVQGLVVHPIIEYIFRILFEQKAEETSLAYLVRFITPFVYQRAQKMLKILTGDLSKGIMNYFWNKSICELVIKALQAEGESEFYEEQKLELVRIVCESVGRQENQSKLEGLVESFAEFLEGLVEKHEDKYEKEKYSHLIKEIIARADNFAFLIELLEKYPNNHVIKTEALHCIEAFLRIHLPNKQNNSKISNSSVDIVKATKVNEKFIESLKKTLLTLPMTAFVSDIRLQLLFYFKLIKMLVIVQPDISKDILTKEFLTQSLKIMQKDPCNNILHNYQKDIFIEGTKNSAEVYVLIKNQIGFEEILRENLTDKVSRKSYESQLFLIGEAVKAKTEELQTFSTSWSDLEQTIKQKREFYSILIGGDPRNSNDDKWDNFQSEVVIETVGEDGVKNHHSDLLSNKMPFSSCTPKLDELGGTEVLSEEGEDLQDQVEKKNNHYFDFQLPLDSDKEEQKESGKDNQEDENIIIRVYSLTEDYQAMVSPPVLEPSPIVPVQEEERGENEEEVTQGSTLKPNEDAFTQQFGGIVISTQYNVDNPIDQQPTGEAEKEPFVIPIQQKVEISSIPANEEEIHAQILVIQQKEAQIEVQSLISDDFEHNLGMLKMESIEYDKPSQPEIESKEPEKVIDFVEFVAADPVPAREEIEIGLTFKYGLTLRRNTKK